MPRFYFDFDCNHLRVVEGDAFDLRDAAAGRDEILKALAEIVKDALPKNDQQTFQASVRDESGHLAYTATVTMTGLWHAPYTT
ncbi:DUF6894 family protein [Methylobacterium sp. Leaf113]|uniref:DUF6894 family protein n=1 Tax=Methylobacterium sp. Leaf113 TaxID=1736259 RepID=UPI0006FB3345